MTSDRIRLSNQAPDVGAALGAAEQMANSCGLSPKNGLYLRLLSEEMVALVRSITGEVAGDFWIENEGGEFRLEFATQTMMTPQKREELLKTSTTGKNAGRTGILGKIKDVVERYIESYREEGIPEYYTQGLVLTAQGQEEGQIGHGTNSDAITWSLSKYKDTLTSSGASGESWDELERSVISKVADEVSVSIRSGLVEVTIYKKMK